MKYYYIQCKEETRFCKSWIVLRRIYYMYIMAYKSEFIGEYEDMRARHQILLKNDIVTEQYFRKLSDIILVIHYLQC